MRCKEDRYAESISLLSCSKKIVSNCWPLAGAAAATFEFGGNFRTITSSNSLESVFREAFELADLLLAGGFVASSV